MNLNVATVIQIQELKSHINEVQEIKQKKNETENIYKTH